VLVGRARDIEVAATDIIDSFVVNEEGTVRILNSAVGGENSIVRLDDRIGDSW